MASHRAGAAGCGFGVPDGNFPFAEARNFFLYELGLVGSMLVMAGLAGTSLDLPVDMERMEVLVTIAELGGGIRLQIQSNIPVVTFETEGKIAGIIGEVKLHGRTVFQGHAERGSMRVVADETIAGLDRFMDGFAADARLLVTALAQLGNGLIF
jgi:hypothetical protein